MDKIETMRAFIAVAQEGTFTSAGRRLGLSTKLVSKYVQHLEGQLKTQLFNRTTRSVSLTDVGAAIWNIAGRSWSRSMIWIRLCVNVRAPWPARSG